MHDSSNLLLSLLAPNFCVSVLEYFSGLHNLSLIYTYLNSIIHWTIQTSSLPHKHLWPEVISLVSEPTLSMCQEIVTEHLVLRTV